jgi:cysteine desulfurase
LPNNINVCIPGIEAEFAVIQLDTHGIACASVSSCKNLTENSSSYVISALDTSAKNCADSSLRFSLGRATTKAELDKVLKLFPNDIRI